MKSSRQASPPQPPHAGHPKSGPASHSLTLALLLSLPVPLPAAPDDLPNAFSPEKVLWSIELGTHQYTVPRIDQDQVFIGINDIRLAHPTAKRTGGGVLMCLDRASGALRWQFVIPRYMEGTQAPFHFNHWKCGVCSRPALAEKQLYIVAPRGDILCLDRFGQANGNDGPFLEESSYMGVPAHADYQLSPTDGDLLWRYDMIKELGVVPHDVCGSSPLLHGNYLYACTSNGVDDTHRNVANPSAPSLIVLHRRTGQLAATDGEPIGQRLLHGQWSSPVFARFGNQDTILFGAGDGILYAFEPWSETGPDTAPGTLKKIWQHDCVPPDYRYRDGQPIAYCRWNSKTTEGPSEIIAIPVVDGPRIYASIGQSPVHGPGLGMLSCIDGATGQTIWENRQVGRTLSDPALHNGLLYITDYEGRLHCLEANTGTTVWQQDLEGGVWCASPVLVHDHVYISTEKRMLWILKAGREKQVLHQSRLPSEAITPVVDNNVLFFPTQYHLFAIRL